MENYNKLLEKAREAYSKCVTGAEKRRLESIFPELKESNDEKIRKEILDYFKDLDEHGYPTKEWTTWVEKQGEKETDKVELCFGHSPYLKEQDGKMLESIIECIDGTGLLDSDQIDWLKSFKDKYSIKDNNALLEKQVEQADYNPYKATIESIAAMVERYADNGDLKDFYDNIKVKCKDAMEYGKTLSEKQVEQKETPCDRCKKEQPSHSCQDITELGRCYLEHEKQGKKDGKVIFPKFTFDDILVLECCMKMAEKEEKFYKQLQSLHNRVHDAYWLEREKEQKSPTKVEPEFKILDWVIGRATGNEPRQIAEITKDGYKTTYGGWIGFSFENEMRLWTVQDAKDGDVLVNKYGVIFINDGNREGKVTLDSYCYLSVQYEFCINEHKTGSWLYKDGIKPATKEQRDFFFAKMKEAGYEWDTENKVLRKQDEKKSTNKVEPKFKAGDWIYKGCNILKIRGVSNEYYCFETEYGYINDLPISEVDSLYHLWTIKDAKDGDVVVDKSNGTIGIFQSIGHDPDGGSHNDPSYCFLHCRYGNGFFYADFENGNMIDADDLIPATKEQRNFLFQKMKENCYEWNAENKELRKQCNQESIDKVKPKFQQGQWIFRKGLHPALIVNINNDKYEIEFTDNGVKGTHPIDFIDRVCHLWTTEDAEDGDVLAIGNTYFLFKGETLKSSPDSPAVYISHCFVHSTGVFRLANGRDCGTFHSIENGIKVRPATKEQRDFLFQKMKEAGYGWDAKEKVLIDYEKE